MATNSVQQPANLHDRPTKVRLDKSDMIIRGITQVEEALRTLREMVEPAEEAANTTKA